VERKASSTDGHDSIDTIAALLASTRAKGARLWSENGRLRCKAPKGALSPDEIEGLRLWKAQIAALLESAAGSAAAGLPPDSNSRIARAPLAFSQLAHWNCYQLRDRPAIRQIASALRLRGTFDLDALRASLAEVVRRHDALRTRVIILEEVPIQEISESVNRELQLIDLTSFSESARETEVQRLIESQILQPIDPAADPLFEARLLRLRDDEHVLVLTMEHMISDGFSLDILLREIFSAYRQATHGHALSLPAIPVQFPRYAAWQRSSLESWIEAHGRYWSERLAGCGRLRFPDDKTPPTQGRLRWGTVPVRIDAPFKAELCAWCRSRRTTLPMSVLTAYTALVLRWCDASTLLIQYQSDGRVTPDLQNTIGYLAFMLNLRVELRQGDRFVDFLDRVAEECFSAQEHADASYFAAQLPPPEWTKSSVFNWVPVESKLHLVGPEDGIACSPVDFIHPMAKVLDVDKEPSILLFDTEGGEVTGELWFPLNRISAGTMERFSSNFLHFIRALIRRPEGRVREISML
jgi:hypothetical protein